MSSSLCCPLRSFIGHCPGLPSSFLCESREPGWEKVVATESGTVVSPLQERLPPSDKPQPKQRPQLVPDQRLEAFPSSMLCKGQVLLP